MVIVVVAVVVVVVVVVVVAVVVVVVVVVVAVVVVVVVVVYYFGDSADSGRVQRFAKPFSYICFLIKYANLFFLNLFYRAEMYGPVFKINTLHLVIVTVTCPETTKVKHQSVQHSLFVYQFNKKALPHKGRKGKSVVTLALIFYLLLPVRR